MSGPVYDLSQRVDPSGERYQERSPFWVVLVVRQKYPLTYDRAFKRSRSPDGSQSAAERGKPLILTEATSLHVQGQKGSPLKNMAMTMPPGEVDYGTQIHAGDWCCAWMLDNQTDGKRLLSNLEKLVGVHASADGLTEEGGPPGCNYFLSGLKFVGQVRTRRKSWGTNAEGVPQTRWTVTANGFTEMDSSIYWDPYLAQVIPEFNTWIGYMGVALSKFLEKDGISVNGAIPELLDLLFGRGISQQAANPAADPLLQIGTGLTQGTGEAPFSFVVPETIGKVLGKVSRSKTSGVLATADVLRLCQGVQSYNAHGIEDPQQSQFWPSSLAPMLGSFLPTIPDLAGKNVWSLLSTYLNPTINEMYTAMRPGPSGNIEPVLVVRQLPFSTPLGPTNCATTRFLDLPRWKLPPQMIKSGDLGTSDALRVNFVHLIGTVSAQSQNADPTYQLLRNPPIRDAQDIQRSGLRPEISQVQCGLEDLTDPDRGTLAWTQLRADMVMGQHLALNGPLTSYGIQEPIAEGDNLELDGVVFHLESVSHTCAMVGTKKQFITYMELSHGMAADADQIDEIELRYNQLKLYPGIESLKELHSLTDFAHDVNGPHQGENVQAGDAETGALELESAQREDPFDTGRA